MMQGLDPGKAEGPVAAEEPRRSMIQSPPRSRERGPRIPAHLPIVEEVIVPEPVKGCPEAWRCIGEEVTEQLDYEPARFFKRRIVRRKYVRADHPYAAPIIAPLQTLQDRCIGAPGLIAAIIVAIIVAKYCDHLPLYRQEQIFATRHRVEIPRQTMAQWLALAAEWLRPIYEHIRTGVLGGGYVQVDETPIEYLVPGNGETKLGYLWSCARPGGDTVFAWHTSRAAACLENIIPADFRGTVQSDGYAAYPAFTRVHNTRAGSEAIVLAGCWAHARRAILEASEGAPRTCRWLLRQIGALYKIEAHLRQKRAGPNLREALRAAQSVPLLRRIRAAMLRIRARYLPQTAMAKAITYTLEQWPALERFASDGHIEIDNNNVENAIRPTAIGKKKLALHRSRRRWPARSRPLHDRRKLPSPSPRPFCLSARHPHPPPQTQPQPDPRRDSRRLGQSPAPARAPKRCFVSVRPNYLRHLRKPTILPCQPHRPSSGARHVAYDETCRQSSEPGIVIFCFAAPLSRMPLFGSTC